MEAPADSGAGGHLLPGIKVLAALVDPRGQETSSGRFLRGKKGNEDSKRSKTSSLLDKDHPSE